MLDQYYCRRIPILNYTKPIFIIHTHVFSCWIAGSYIYIESSSPRREGDIARLLSGPYNSDQTVCVQFFYHMFGPNVGYLAVAKFGKPFNKMRKKVLWRRTGQIDMYWHKAMLTIYDENEFMVCFSERSCIPIGIIVLNPLMWI